MNKRSSNLAVLAMAALTLSSAMMSATAQTHAQQKQKGKDPLYNPRAVAHQIDRSAMSLQIQGWTRDLKYPVYPVKVMGGSDSTYYVTKDSVDKYQEFNIDTLACEIGKAPVEVLKDKKYLCQDGVCFSADAGAIIGVDPRKTVKKMRC